MPSTYSTLKIQLMATGENNTTWGDVTNTNLGTALEEAIVGSADVTFASNNVTLTLTDTNATQTARNVRLRCTGTTGGATRNLVVPAIEKPYIVKNDCADSIVVKTAAGSGITVPAGKTMWVYNDGTNVVDAITRLSSLTLGTALAVADGGTGQTALTAGYVVKGNGTSALSSGVIYDDGTNVGIGTSSPTTKLDVNGVVSSGNISVRGDAVEGGQISLYDKTNSAVAYTFDVDPSNHGRLFTTANNTNLTIGQLGGTGGNVIFATAFSERMRIDASGNIGVGTSSPAAKLDVLGGIRARGGTPGALGINNNGYAFSNPGDNDSGMFSSADGQLEFYLNNTEIVRFVSGSVGIGTTTPAATLDVSGTVKFSGALTSGNLADAVGYKGLPQNARTSSYTLALSDMGKHVSITTGGVVIPANASVAFPVGSAISIYNDSSSNQTISITSDTLYLAGTATTGSRTLAQRGFATVVKVNSTTWIISGAGVS